MKMINLGFIAAVVTLNFTLCFSACARAEYEVNGECCPMCAPGNRVYWHCTVDTSTTCVPCLASTYTDEPNGVDKCFPCSVCDASNGLRVKRTCTRSADTVCEPLKGFYCIEQNKDSCRFAMGHSQCIPGQYIKQAGTASTDTVCGNCMEGTYSNGSFTACQPHSKCETEGRNEIKPGTVSSDAECGNSTPVGIIAGSIVGAVCILATAVGIYFIYFKLIHKGQTPETYTNNCQLPVQESVSVGNRGDSELKKRHSTSIRFWEWSRKSKVIMGREKRSAKYLTQDKSPFTVGEEEKPDPDPMPLPAMDPNPEPCAQVCHRCPIRGPHHTTPYCLSQSQ